MRTLLCGMAALVMSVSMTPSATAQDNDEIVQLVVGLIKDSDKDMRSLGLEQVRSEAKGTKATEQFAALLPTLAPDVQAGLLGALTVRGDAAARPAVLDLLKKQNGEEVQVAAITALGALGEEADVAQLVSYLSSDSESIKASAKAALVQLRGKPISPAITELMNRAPPTVRVDLIDALTSRRAIESIPDILSAAVDKDASVRSAAMKSLGRIAGPEDVEGMVKGVLRAESSRERADAEKNVMFVCNRIEDPEQRAEPLLTAIKKLSRGDQLKMMSTLGRVGGAEALTIVKDTINDRDARTHEIGIKALCNWPNSAAVPRLIELAQSDDHPAHRTSALRALIRIAPLSDGRNDLQKLSLLKTSMMMCERDTERSFVLERARAIRIPESLEYVLRYLDQPAFTETVCETIVELAHHRNLREPNKAEFHSALDKVIATSKDPTSVDRAQRYKENKTWVRPK